jgi:hypothetical protein
MPRGIEGFGVYPRLPNCIIHPIYRIDNLKKWLGHVVFKEAFIVVNQALRHLDGSHPEFSRLERNNPHPGVMVRLTGVSSSRYGALGHEQAILGLGLH